MRFDVTRVLFAWIAVCVLGLAGCGGQGQSETGPRYPNLVEPKFLADGRIDPAVLADEQILHRSNGSEPQTLDPHTGEGVPSSHVLRELVEGLVTKAPDGAIVPGQAESWTISEDGRVYTFTLREGLQWSNGDPLTAEDWVYSYRRALDPATGSKYGFLLYPIANARQIVAGDVEVETLGVQALDPRTVEITLASSTPYFLQLLTHSMAMPVHRATIEAHGDNWARPETFVGNGPFTLSEWRVQQHIKVDKNPLYRDAENVILDTIYFYPIEDQSSDLARFRAGEVDWTYELPNNQYRWIKENMADQLVVSPYLGIYYYGFNLTKPPFKDNPALRKALSLAIDRETITDKIAQFGEQPAYAFVPPGVAGYETYQHPWAAMTREERLALARQLYEEAGYSAENPLKTEIRYNTSENHKRIAVAVQAMWKDNLGADVAIVNEEWKVFLQTRKTKDVTQVYRAGWIGDYDDANSFLELNRSTSGLNDSAYMSPEYDALLDRAAQELDPETRRQIMLEAEMLLLEDMPVAPIYSYVTKRLVAPYVGGWENNIQDYHYGRYMYILKH